MPKSKLPTITIVIPAYNEEDCIIECLESCVNQTIPADEILVVNNNSADRTKELVKEFIKKNPTSHVRLVDQNEKGLVPTRNKGFDSVKSDVIGRIDADCMLEPGWVEAVKSKLTDTTIFGTTGPVIYHDMPAKKVWHKADDNIRKALNKMTTQYQFLFGSNMAIRTEAWHVIKDSTASDQLDLLHEDIDIALCFSEHNLKVSYNPKMIAGMSARRFEDNPKDFFHYVMRFERTFKRHGISSASARIPIFIYLSIYFPGKLLRSFYDAKQEKFTTAKVKKMLIDRLKTLDI